jgi:pathogenesis-related protein 1
MRHAAVVALALPLAAALIAGCGRRAPRAGGAPGSGQWQAPAPGAAPGGAAPQPMGGGAPPGDPQRLLDAHNAARAEHCAPPLGWSPAIAATAQRWADTLGQRGCGLEHSSGPLGENLAAGTAMTPERAVSIWVEERRGYDFGRGAFSMTTGHFTQVVWRESRLLGCGSAACGGGMKVWVCNYDPPGNMEGAFPRNVGPVCRR